jgi:hypothetical protein
MGTKAKTMLSALTLMSGIINPPSTKLSDPERLAIIEKEMERSKARIKTVIKAKKKKRSVFKIEYHKGYYVLNGKVYKS